MNMTIVALSDVTPYRLTVTFVRVYYTTGCHTTGCHTIGCHHQEDSNLELQVKSHTHAKREL